MTQWHRPQPKRRPPTQADVEMEDDADEMEETYDDVWPSSTPRSARRYTPLSQRESPAQPVVVVDRRRQRAPQYPGAASAIPLRSSAAGRPQTLDDPQYRLRPGSTGKEEQALTPAVPPAHPRRRMHWVFFVGVGMLGMLLLWYGGLALVSWWQVSQDDLHYGRPRTFQCDAVVGHHDSLAHPSHFLALNYHRQVEIIELPGGDSSHARIYLGPPLLGPGEDLAVVTLSFRDVNGDGKPDMLVTVAGSQVIFINDQGQFRPLRNGEHVTL